MHLVVAGAVRIDDERAYLCRALAAERDGREAGGFQLQAVHLRRAAGTSDERIAVLIVHEAPGFGVALDEERLAATKIG